MVAGSDTGCHGVQNSKYMIQMSRENGGVTAIEKGIHCTTGAIFENCISILYDSVKS